MKKLIRQLVNDAVKFSEDGKKRAASSEQISLSVVVADKPFVPPETVLDQQRLAEKVLTGYLERGL